MNDLNLYPKIGIGDFKLGQPIQRYLEHYPYEYFPKLDEDLSRGFYSFFDGVLDVYINDNANVDYIRVEKHCVFNGVNLIGKRIEHFKEILDIEALPTYEKIFMLVGIEYQTQKVYDIDSVGLQVWTYRNRVVTITIWNPDDYDD